jgi:hypothetical protein
MIINIRGTSGSGKSTIMRKVMELYPEKVAFQLPVEKPRKQPHGYMLRGAPGTTKDLCVLGHYETACGGCDTLPNYEFIFNMIRQAADKGNDVLFEGLLVTADQKHTPQLVEDGYDVNVIGLTTPVEECLEGIRLRRLARDNTDPVNPKNTLSKHKQGQGCINNMMERGVKCEYLDRDEAFLRVKELLNVQ